MRNNILGISPYLEIAVRKIYWHSDFLIRYKNRGNKKKKKSIIIPRLSLADIEQKLRQMSISDGNLLIVHSSYNALKPTGATPNDIIDMLLELIGPNGTLALPTIPTYSNVSELGRHLITRDVSEEVIEYNPQRTPSGTGIITNIFLTYPGVVRSKHPLNTMAALGPLAEQIIKNNLDGYEPLPCGVNSSWKFCADNNAKILALGVDMAHSLTMIHVAEDINPDKWPADWYRKRKCRIIENENQIEIIVRERHPKWAMYYAERTLYKDLLKSGIMKSDSLEGIRIELIDDSKRLIDYLNSRNDNYYPYYCIRRN